MSKINSPSCGYDHGGCLVEFENRDEVKIRSPKNSNDSNRQIIILMYPIRKMKLNKLFLIFIVAALIIQLGCSDDAIVKRRVPKERSGLEKLRQSNTPVVDSVPKQKTRMAVAIFENPEATWFFKISGPADRVDKSESQWKKFFQSVSFTDNEPKWEAPDDWTTAGPKPMRHTTLIIDKTDPPLELAISSLGPNQDLLLNINRWRGQIGLKASTESELDQQIEKLENDNGKYLIFDAVGVGAGQMRPPFAGGGGKPPFAPFAGSQSSPGASQSTSLAFEPIEGWSEGKTSSMVHARLTKNVDDAQVQITVIEMPADSNKWEPNVMRWAQQVELGSLSESEFAKRTTPLVIDGVEGKMIDLIDLESKSNNGTIAGMVKKDGSAWFLKLAGEKELTDKSRAEFEKFLSSLKFK